MPVLSVGTHRDAADAAESLRPKRSYTPDTDTTNRITKMPKLLKIPNHVRQTDRFRRYNPAPAVHGANPPAIERPNTVVMADFDHYPLYMLLHQHDILSEPPPSGCRLDDHTIGRLLIANSPPNHERSQKLAATWPAEFDNRGMVRAKRLPLGHAVKLLVHAGDQDCDGVVASVADAGWFYGWWRGIHPLVGQEGQDHDLSPGRISQKGFRSPGMTWYIGSRCAIQLPPGDPGDPTFTGRLEDPLTDRPTDRPTDPNIFERQALAPEALAAVATAVADRVLGGLAGKHHHFESAAYADMSDLEAIAKVAGGVTGTGGRAEGRANLRV